MSLLSSVAEKMCKILSALHVVLQCGAGGRTDRLLSVRSRQACIRTRIDCIGVPRVFIYNMLRANRIYLCIVQRERFVLVCI